MFNVAFPYPCMYPVTSHTGPFQSSSPDSNSNPKGPARTAPRPFAHRSFCTRHAVLASSIPAQRKTIPHPPLLLYASINPTFLPCLITYYLISSIPPWSVSLPLAMPLCQPVPLLHKTLMRQRTPIHRPRDPAPSRRRLRAINADIHSRDSPAIDSHAVRVQPF